MVDGALMNEVLAGEFAPAEDDLLKEFTFRAKCTTIYEVVVQAPSEEEARRHVEDKLDYDPYDLSLIENEHEGGFSLEEPAPAWVPENHWDEHDHLHVEEWMYDVACRNTRLSYAEWVNSQLEAE